MSWLRLFELFIIISLLVCAIKIRSEKIEVEEERDELAKERKELLDIANEATATFDKVKIRNSKLQETMLWFAHEAGELQIYSGRDTKVQYIKAEDLSNLIMRLTDKIVKIK